MRNPWPDSAPRPTTWLKSKTRPATTVVSIAHPFFWRVVHGSCEAPSSQNKSSDEPEGMLGSS